MSGERDNKGIGSSWREPLLTVIGMAATLAIVAGFSRSGSVLILGAVLALTLSRSHLTAHWRGRAEALILLPFIAAATGGVGFLLKTLPPLGAVCFAGALFLSIWLRRFGSDWKRIGSLLALPFITLLITPVGAGGLPLAAALLLPILVLLIVSILRIVAEFTGFLPKTPEVEIEARAAQESKLRPIPSTRMALQMMTAVLAAFILGWQLFPTHVTWVVLTAFLVCSGNRGRADVLHKSGLRIIGAAAGTLLATGLVAVLAAAHGQAHASGAPEATGIHSIGGVALLLAIIGVGLWAREWSYAAWALAMTLVVTLLRSGATASAAVDAYQSWERVIAIVVGAVCGLAMSWFVLPIRSEPVVRLRIANTLAALGEFLAERDDARRKQLRFALNRLEEVAPPWDALERLAGRFERRPPAGRWIRLTRECCGLAISNPKPPPLARRLNGEARKALREPERIEATLVDLHQCLSGLPSGSTK